MEPVFSYRPLSLDWWETETETSYTAKSARSRWSAVRNGLFAVVWWSSLWGHCPLPFMIFGIYFTYMVVAEFVNSTTVTMDTKEFRKTCGPLPVGGNVRQPLAAIEGFAPEVMHGAKGKIWYKVHVLTRSATKVGSFSFDDESSANYAAGRLNEALTRIRTKANCSSRRLPYR
ncbi:hypothetical protein LZC95_27130 [Pendulispora brunnea]|uniref:Uncharacterized protein n=1 Tax=Pendulispora brunnea TaxID=2905690 RepID=A0ABZ2JUH5_9BACT